GLTFAVGWEPGTITSRPTEEERQAAAAAARRAEVLRLWPLGLPLLGFFLGFRAWRRRGRDPKGLPVVVTYEPPDGLTPAEVGTLVDHTAEMRDVISTLVDLAVRGYVGIEEREEKKLLGLISTTEYVFHRRRPRETWGELRPHERSFLNALFSAANTMQVTWSAVKAAMVEAMRARDAGQDADPRELVERAVASQQGDSESVELSDLQNKFYSSLPGIRDDIYEELVRKGYYDHRPDKVKAVWMGLGVLAMIAGVMSFVFAVGGEWGWVNPIALAVGVAVSGVVLMVFGAVMPARTMKGARTREASLGFREFLDKVESDRYRQMITSPELFERFLPYAMAFGVEGRWARAFEDLYKEPPDWYSGSGYHGFRATAFTSRMSTLTSRAGSTMSSSPSSSGSGGGGSSGGGSGGGGGSGF
ncbi:MAG TPA: DUF2207 domain-containing protein, partial [Longimicrobiaceae bacterium]|nr:DUF2207 domain-containing protein [Longimicrobiaceae bacterium]